VGLDGLVDATVEDLLGNLAHNTNRKALAETGNSNRERDRRLGRPFVRQNVDYPGGSSFFYLIEVSQITVW